MKKNLIIGILFLITGFLGMNFLFAQGYGTGSSGGGSNSGSGQGAPTQPQPAGNNSPVGQQGVQVQDREMLQIQDRDRLQIQDQRTQGGDGPDQLREQERIRINAQNYGGIVTATSVAQLRQMIQLQEREFARRMIASSTEMSSSTENVFRNQNRARVATQALIAANGLMGDSGGKILQIANQINYSLGTTTNAELQIQERSRFSRFFWGGDKQNSAVIQGEIAQNMARINQANQLLDSPAIPEQLREILRTQIQQLEQEQNRLQNLVQEQIGKWGIFSWRFN